MSERSVKKAGEVYTLWSQKEPEEAQSVDFEFPETVVCVGSAETIVYHSDKWEAEFYDYIHEFDSDPEVWMQAPRLNDGEEDEAHFEVPVVKSVSSILHMRLEPHKELALPLLGVVLEFDYNPIDGGPRQSLHFKDPPVLCCTLDKRAIVIFSGVYGPIIVRGGKMVVTERGIHH